MAQAFNLTAQLQLQAPGNVDQVVNQIRRQLKPIGIQVNIQNAKNLAQANSSLSSFNKNAQASTKSMNQLNRTLQESARRFSVITIATGSFLALANAFKNSVKEAVAFERELVKISQVTGKTVSQLSSLSNEVTRLSTSLGTSSSDLLNVARTLTQAGFAADDTRRALEVLAQTSLGATFDNIQDTTEGAIALLRQFSDEARSTGGDVAFLEKSLSAISAVSKSFAVESSDLISAIRRTGGVFSAAGGSINELIALFTSVRATTRESAETIATGLRTIFTRIQRPETIDQLRQIGVELQDAQGNFVGAFEAFKRLSQGLKGLDPRSSAFSQIVEDLGGFRQVGKVIPLIQQFTTAQRALSVAQGASGTVAKDAETAQQSLGVQIQKTREQFDALIRRFVDSSAFRSLATGGLELAKAFIRIADSLEPLLPLLITLAGLKLGKGLAPALGSFVGIGKSVGGAGPVTKFASGGMVPGSGNRDTVPAMLTPGEFVIRKSSVKKLGAGTLAAMNENRFNRGARIKEELDQQRKTDVFDFKKGATIQAGKGGSGSLKAALSQADLKAEVDPYQAVFLRPEAQGKQFNGEISNSNLKLAVKEAIEGTGIPKTQLGTANQIAERYAKRNKFTLSAGSLTSSESARLEGTLLDGVFETAKKGAKDINNSLGIQGEKNIATALRSANIDQVLGNLFEVVLSNAGAPFGMPDTDPPNAPFDFPSGLGNISKKFGLQQGIATEAKSFFSESNLATINKKIQNQLINESIDELRTIYRQNLTGGKEISLDEAKKAFGSTKLNRDDITRLAEAEGLDFTKVSGGKYTLTRRNAGGGISGSDTVPALLTPGEFVMNKSAAQSIGYTNLNRMNKHGVQGYAKGGTVGVKRFASGGKSSGGSGFSFGDMDAFVRSVSQSIGEVDLFSYAVSEAKNETELLAYALSELKEFGDVVAETSDKIEASADSSGVSGDSDKTEKAEKKQVATINQTQKSLQGFQRGLAAVDKVAGAAQQFVFVGAAAGTLVNEFTNASETTKTAINRTAGELASIVGIAGTVVQVFTSLASAAADRVSDLQEQASDNITIQVERAAQAATAQHTVALEADAAAMARHAAAVNADTVVEAKNSVVVEADTVVEASNTAAKAGGGLAGFGKLLTGLLNPLNLLLIGITALVAVFVYSKNKIKAENEALARSAKELADKFRETGEGLEQTRSTLLDVAKQSIESRTDERQRSLRSERDSIRIMESRGQLSDEQRRKNAVRKSEIKVELKEIELYGANPEFERFRTSLDESLNSFKSLTDASNEQEEAFRRIGDSVFDAATKFQETINILDEYGKNFNAQVIGDISKRIQESASFERLAGDANPVTGFRPGTISSQQQLDEYLENPYAESVPVDIRSDVVLLKQNLNELAKIQDVAAKNTDVSSRALNDALGRASSSADVDISEGSNTEVAQAYRKLRENINLESAARITQLRILQEIISDKAQKEAIDKQIREIENATAARAVAEEEYIAKVGKTIDIRNSNLKIQAEIKARQDNIESMNKLAEVTDRLSDLMARSRGEDPNDAGVISRNNLTRALQQEIRRNTAALDLSQRSFGLVNASLVGNLSALQARRSELVSAQSGIGKDDAEGLNENRQAIAAIDNEIKRIATDDSLTNSLFGAIEDNVKLIQKEQAARKQVIGVLEEFVVGGDEVRTNLAEAAAGVRAAIATGSVQNQSEDQRKATFSLLDKLSDTIITFDRATGEGLTGSDVKERIIFQDAIRMGLDPEIARELATATSVEQQLIKSNEMLALQIQMLTFTMSQATLAMGANAAADAARGATTYPYTGGYIGSSGTLYRSGGGSIFKPKGTDTVPAMLTPGEFVIKKSAVDKIGVGTLQQINEGGGVVYRQNGSTNPEGYKKWLEKNKTTDSSYSRAAYDIEEERSFQEFMGEVDAQQILNNASDPSNTRTPTRGVVSRPGRLVHTGQGSGLYGAGYQEDERTREFWDRRENPMKYATDEARRTKGMSQADFNAEVQNKGGNAVILGSRTGTKGKRYNPLKERQAARLQKKRDSLYGAGGQQPQQGGSMDFSKMMEFFMQMMMMQMMSGYARGGVVYRQNGSTNPEGYKKWLEKNKTTDSSYSRAAYDIEEERSFQEFMGEVDAQQILNNASDPSNTRTPTRGVVSRPGRLVHTGQGSGLYGAGYQEDERTREFWERRNKPRGKAAVNYGENEMGLISKEVGVGAFGDHSSMQKKDYHILGVPNRPKYPFHLEENQNQDAVQSPSDRTGITNRPSMFTGTTPTYKPQAPKKYERTGYTARRRERLTGRKTYSAEGYGTFTSEPTRTTSALNAGQTIKNYNAQKYGSFGGGFGGGRNQGMRFDPQMMQQMMMLMMLQQMMGGASGYARGGAVYRSEGSFGPEGNKRLYEHGGTLEQLPFDSDIMQNVGKKYEGPTDFSGFDPYSTVHPDLREDLDYLNSLETYGTRQEESFARMRKEMYYANQLLPTKIDEGMVAESGKRARDRQARAMQPAGLPNIEEDARTAEFWDRRENPMKYATDEARRTKGMSQADFNAEVQNKGGNAVILGSRTGTKGKRYNPLKERQAARLQKKRDSLYGADTQQPQTNQMQGMTPEKMMEFFMQMMMMQMMGGAMRFASGGIVQYRQYGEGIDPVDYEKWLKENDTTDGAFSRAAYKQQADMIAAQFQGEADAYNLIDTSDQRARDRQARAMQPAGLPNIEEDARTAEFWDRRENPMKYASAEAKRTKNMSQADFYAEAEANAQKSGRGGPNYSPVVLGSTLNKPFPSDPTEEDLKAIGAVKRGGAAARRRKRLTGKDTYSASGYGTRSFNVKKQETEIKQRPPTVVQEDTTISTDLASRKPDFLSLGRFMRGKESTISSMDRRLITNNAATRTRQQTDNAIADEQDRANAVVEEQGRVRQFYAPDSNRTNKPSGNNTAPVESDGLHGSGQQMMQMMQMMMMMQTMGAQRGSRMMNDGRQRSRMGSGFLNFLGGGRRQQQQQYRPQMVPFGYIPGSPYNSMLGRGGYNIPMFDKRMLFGNGAAFFANGGAAAGGDTVPAMLTPGEFVMNKGAVSKYGTAFMRNLNKGKVQGFNKGGMVQYRQNGGEALGSSAAGPQAMGIDTSKIEGVFSSFVDNISSTFDNLVSPLNGVVQSLNQIAQSFGNFTMQHTVNVEGLINVGGLNVETLKNELSSSIGEMVASEVAKVMDNQNKTFKSN